MFERGFNYAMFLALVMGPPVIGITLFLLERCS